MKKISITVISLLLVLSVLFFSGCEFEIGIGDKEEPTTQVAQNELPEGSGKSKKDNKKEADSDKNDGKEDAGKKGSGDKDGGSSGSVTLSKEEQKINKEFYTLKDKDEIQKNKSISSERIKEGKKDEKKEEKKDEEKILSEKKYTVKGRMVANGITTEYKLAQDGDKYAVITAYNGVPIGFIIGEENIYLMSYDDKTYMEIPLSLLESASEDGEGSIDSILKESIVQADKKLEKEGTETIDGKDLDYKKYEDGSVDYYSGSLIIMSKASDGSIVYYDELSDDAPASLFVPPQDYERVPLTADNLQKFTTMIGGEVDE